MIAANQISGYTFDVAGNPIDFPGTGGATYGYNAAYEMTSSSASVTYVYDGNGNRVEKSGGTIYWYGVGGEVLDETDLGGNLQNEYVYFGGKRVARRDSSGNIYYYFADDLGTTRGLAEVPSGQSNASLCYDSDFYPFGGERTPIANSCTTAQHYKFTGKERDQESGNDYFGARYYSSNDARFMSPDWSAKVEPVPYAKLDDPQSLNLYDYMLNNPLGGVDADGHSTLVFDGKAHTITLYSKNGQKIGTWTAYNHVGVHFKGKITSGPMPNGVHAIRPADRHGAVMHVGGSANGEYGKHGIVHVVNYKGIRGNTVRGAGVHSGRSNKGGPTYWTNGCVRTTDKAMATINTTAKSDPLTSLTVKNNGSNITHWKQRAGIK